MYKVFIISRNEQIQGCLDTINKEGGTIRFVLDGSNMYIFYDVPDYRSDI